MVPRAHGSMPPSRATRVILVRHGTTALTGKVLYGRSKSVHLSEAGIVESQAVAQLLKPLRIAAVYSSPLDRSMETAQPIARVHGLRVRKLDGVLEVDYGTFRGWTFKRLVRNKIWQAVHKTPSQVRFPGGETLYEMQSRVVAALQDVAGRHPGRNVVIVTHKDPIQASLAFYSGAHLDYLDRFDCVPGSVSVIEFSSNGSMIRKMNETGTLDDLARREHPGLKHYEHH